MGTNGLKKWALLLTFWVAMQFSRLHADQTITGNLSVTGNTDLEGSNLTLGTRSDNSNPGAGLLYTDGSSSILEFDASRASNLWKWQQNGGATPQLQMTLDASNKLTLYDQSSTPNAKVVLNPLGTSTFSNSLTVNGTDNEMPNQSLVNSNSVLTEGLADQRYILLQSNDSLALNPSAAAPGSFSIASGWGAVASGQASLAMGNTTASGNYSIAVGTYPLLPFSGYAQTSATGNLSLAMGAGVTASGNYSLAFGELNAASGKLSTAFGNLTTASAYESFVIGQYNVGGGSASSWVPTDPLFEIGDGSGTYTPGSASGYTFNSISWYYSPTYPSGAWFPESFHPGLNAGILYVGYVDTGSGYEYNVEYRSLIWTPPVQPTADAFVVYKNGNAALQGMLTTGGSLTAQGGLTVGQNNPALTANLTVYGDAGVQGALSTNSLSSSGTVVAPTFVTTAPAGDIPMYSGN